jgi:hypothetical protein
VPWTGGALAEILCHQEDRVVGNDNTVSFEKLRLQIEPSPLRHHFAKATVQVRRYLDGTIALFFGPRCIGRFAQDGTPMSRPAGPRDTLPRDRFGPGHAPAQSQNEADNSLVTKTGQVDLLATIREETFNEIPPVARRRGGPSPGARREDCRRHHHPGSAKEKPQEGEVVAVGPGARDGKLQPLELKAGDRVLRGGLPGEP